MIPLPIENLCEDDTVYDHPLVSVSFLLEGKRIFIVKSRDDYLTLKRIVTVTFRIETLEACGGLYKCLLHGTDGTELLIHLTSEDILHNMEVAHSQMEIEQTSTMLC